MSASMVNADITALLKARNTLIWVVSREELRVEHAIDAACERAKYPCLYWDCATGVSNRDAAPVGGGTLTDPGQAINWLRGRKERTVLVMRDLHLWLDPVIRRALRSFARDMQRVQPDVARVVIVLSPTAEVPPELGCVPVLDYPLPDRAEVGDILDTTLQAVSESIRATALADGGRDRAIDAAVGLSADEIQNCYARSLVTTRTIDPAVVSREKQRVIARERVLTWHDPDPRGLDAVGGLDLLKAWLVARRAAFTSEARDFGLPPPKGAMLVGVPGCLAEGTRIPYKRGKRRSGAGRSLPIEALYEKFNGAGRVTGRGVAFAGAAWDPELPTYAQSWDSETGKLVYNEITSVIDNGYKPCIRVIVHGDSVDLTGDHPVLQGDGTWCEARDLVVGQHLLVRGSMLPTSTGAKRIHRKRFVVEGLKHHPHAWRKVVTDKQSGKRYEYGRTTRARLVVEAHMNKVTYDDFVEALKSDAERSEGFQFLPPEYDVHHADEDPQNDTLENLVVHTHDAHAALHGVTNADNFNIEHTRQVPILAIEHLGVRRVYDVTMDEVHPNLVVNNGMIVHNCGKSLTAKAVASAWQMPLLRLDMGALRSKYVGDSEANIRKALRVAEAVSPCILWADEIEKALAGASGPAGDGGVAADALGTLLSWMQERSGSVFVIATANDVRGLPPELLRKGRFDELFWVDLPTSMERRQILAAALRQHGRDPNNGAVDFAAAARFTEGFTGAEISALVPDALFTAFADGRRPLVTSDLEAAAGTVVPLAKTARERIDSLREWAKGRARFASTPESASAEDRRTLDLD